jgi:hypothetical protein
VYKEPDGKIFYTFSGSLHFPRWTSPTSITFDGASSPTVIPSVIWSHSKNDYDYNAEAILGFGKSACDYLCPFKELLPICPMGKCVLERERGDY